MKKLKLDLFITAYSLQLVEEVSKDIFYAPVYSAGVLGTNDPLLIKDIFRQNIYRIAISQRNLLSWSLHYINHLNETN